MSKFLGHPCLLVFVVLICLCCCTILVLCGAALVLVSNPIIAPIVLSPMPFATSDPTPTVVVPRLPVESVPLDTRLLLENTEVPINDPPDLACRLQGKCNIPATLPPPVAPRQVGEQETFWAFNQDTNTNFQVTATLRYVTDHLYFWVQDDVRYNKDDLKALADTFETQIYPTDREFFGSEWTPGVDGDPHIYALYARNLGANVAGLFGSSDEYNPLVSQYSNAHEMFLIDTGTSLGGSYIYSTMAHEFQHMIHWYQDRNEEGWINEGFAELAAFINGYDVGGFDWLYATNPDLQLNDWPDQSQDTAPHYGAGFLYLTYFLDRFGEEATQALVKNQENGMASVDSSLRQIDATDPQTGQPITSDDFFLDWAVTNYVMDGSIGDGRYIYHNYASAPQTSATETVSACPSEPATRTVHQYGVDYIRITCLGDYTLYFTGATSTRILSGDPHSGSYAFWSNIGDVSDMTLTREFDFTAVSAPITFSYWTWYDLEKDYDYVYLEASTDGQHWQILITPSGTAEDPSGNSYGWGYNGLSNGWIQESVDLSQFAGQKVSLRFEYVTDAEVYTQGFLLDDLSIPAINYTTDFESDDSGWQAAGFVRIQNLLPQTFRLALILKGNQSTTVQIIPLSADQTADIPLHLGGGEEATLVVGGTTRFTRELAAYQFEIR
ncbi:MAG: immune inhibitor A [Anaerolineales bacterium]|nr:immune inhibitor A [Anaerolineales bacterium]